MNIVRAIATPLFIALIFLLYQWFIQGNSRNSLWLIPILSLLAGLYTLQHQITYWWKKRHPAKVDEKMLNVLKIFLPQITELSEEDQRKFMRRLDLFVTKREIIGKGLENTPDDIKYLICSYAILLTFNKEDFMMSHFSRIALYKHPFLSPQYPDDIHIVETETEDGTIILSIDETLNAIHHPKSHYNIALHAWIKAYLHLFPVQRKWSDDDIWNKIESVGWTVKSRLIERIGLPVLDPYCVLIHNFVVDHHSFKHVLPEEYMHLKKELHYAF